MFFLIPWKVDVPQDRWPVMNWLVILALIGAFTIQVIERLEYAEGPPAVTEGQADVQTITETLSLDSWNLQGLLGYMWLHGSPLHLLGNILFLWIFGNAVCAKVGNLKYLTLYVLVGVTAGVAHLLFSSRAALGASGAINGIVGMYLVLFYENEITCLFACWFIPWIIVPYVRWFTVDSVWMIVFWLFWDVVGALIGGSGVAYFAHLGGFGAGFGIAWLMCGQGWITMERYEKSLLQMWQQRQARAREAILNAQYLRPGRAAPTGEPVPAPGSKPASMRNDPLFGAFIHTACACGKRLMVSQQYAGKPIRCSECGQTVMIPAASSQPSVLTAPAAVLPHAPVGMCRGRICFACHCGKKIRVAARHAGRSGKCPQCGALLTVPIITPQ